MKLEVIARAPKAPVSAPPLLFVHGAYSGAWVWDQYFLPFFARHGYASHALSLRGHGQSAGGAAVPWRRLRDYVADVAQVAASLPRPPILIGHSMGGLIVQHYLQCHSSPGVVLMASVPPHGLMGSLLGMTITNPGLYRDLAWAQSFGPVPSNGEAVRRALFSDDVPEELFHRFLQRFRAESPLVMLDLMGLDLPPSLPTVELPALVLGAANDAFVYPGALEATARTYHTQPEIFPNMAHAMMLDTGWESVARRILQWLRTTFAHDGAAADAVPTRGAPTR